MKYWHVEVRDLQGKTRHGFTCGRLPHSKVRELIREIKQEIGECLFNDEYKDWMQCGRVIIYECPKYN